MYSMHFLCTLALQFLITLVYCISFSFYVYFQLYALYYILINNKLRFITFPIIISIILHVFIIVWIIEGV